MPFREKRKKFVSLPSKRVIPPSISATPPAEKRTRPNGVDQDGKGCARATAVCFCPA